MNVEINMDREFADRFVMGGTFNPTCDCGREHVAMISFDDWEFGPGEQDADELRADYEEMAKKDSTLVLNYEFDGFDLIELGKRVFVYGCECEGWRPYMNFIIEQRKQIAEFLVDTSKEIKRIHAQEEIMDVLRDEYKINKPYTVST